MLLRISLGGAILAAIAALYFSHFTLGPKITTLNENLSAAETARAAAQDAQTKAQAEARKATEDRDAAQKQYADAAAALETTTARLSEQEKRANQLSENLTTVTRERNEAQQVKAQWDALGIPVEQVRNMRDNMAKVGEERDTFAAENKILLRKNTEVQAELDKYIGGREKPVILPAGLKGQIVAVDPKYDFVVLNIGGNQGVLENGKMLVNRGGKLVGTVKITRVEPTRSIANILPDDRLADVMEGDQVLY